ncbi:histidine kinase [soil metagenome]
MSLRTRLVVLVGLVLFAGVTLGSILAGYEARRTLEAELTAGITGGRQTVLSAYEDLPRSDHIERDLRQLVSTFDGNRHVRARLEGVAGATLVASTPLNASKPAPAWFSQLFGTPPASVRLVAPPPVRDRAIILQPIPDDDLSALWSEFIVIVAAVAGSAVAAIALAYVVIGAALRPLRALSEGFVSVGSGDFRVHIDARGPSELFALQTGFNAMTDQLAAVRSRNRALEDQLITIQDEERADLARDLHDEIGPHLFAVNVDAEIVGQMASAPGLAERVRSIQASVGHMQRLVRDILGRLRPSKATELGLNAAIGDLIAFWQARAPTIAIEADLLADETILNEAIKDTIYRVIQESLSNAVRHAAASRVTVTVGVLGSGEVEVLIADDGRPGPATNAGGFGVIGMRERVSACGGVLIINSGDGRAGWSVSARLPLRYKGMQP